MEGREARSISQSPEYRLNIGPIIKDDETLTLTVTKAYAEAEHSFALGATGDGDGGGVVVDSLPAARNRGVLYSFDDDEHSLVDPSGVFTIDSGSGRITVVAGAAFGAGAYSLNVRVYDTEYVGLYDTGVVNLGVFVSEIQAGFAGDDPHAVNTDGKDASNTMIVGQKVQTRLVVNGPGTGGPTGVHWSLIGGKPIKDYYTDGDSGIVEELDSEAYSGKGMVYFNTNKNTYQIVTCTFTLNGKTYSETLTLYIEHPTVNFFTSEWAQYSNGADPVGVRYHPLAGSILCLVLGGKEIVSGETQDGITWTAEVTPPSDNTGGFIGFTQLVRRTVSYFSEGILVDQDSTNGEYWLDNRRIYKGVSCDKFPSTLVASDSPAVGVSNCWDLITIEDSFNLYLTYKAEGESIFVTLQQLDWGWNGMARKERPDIWFFEDSWIWNGTGFTSGGGDGYESIKLPVWDHIARNGIAVKES